MEPKIPGKRDPFSDAVKRLDTDGFLLKKGDYVIATYADFTEPGHVGFLEAEGEVIESRDFAFTMHNEDHELLLPWSVVKHVRKYNKSLRERITAHLRHDDYNPLGKEWVMQSHLLKVIVERKKKIINELNAMLDERLVERIGEGTRRSQFYWRMSQFDMELDGVAQQERGADL